MRRGYKVTVAIGPGYEPDAVHTRLRADLARPANDPAKAAAKAMRKASRSVEAFEEQAVRMDAGLPPAEQIMRRACRLERVDCGSDAMPAWVVRFENNAPVQRLARSGLLSAHHVQAAERIVGCYHAAVKPPKMTASYAGVGGASKGPAEWIDVHSDAWRRYREAMANLLDVEQKVVVAVAINETPISVVAQQGLTPFTKGIRMEAAVVMALRLGAERLARHFGLDVGDPLSV